MDWSGAVEGSVGWGRLAGRVIGQGVRDDLEDSPARTEANGSKALELPSGLCQQLSIRLPNCCGVLTRGVPWLGGLASADMPADEGGEEPERILAAFAPQFWATTMRSDWGCFFTTLR